MKLYRILIIIATSIFVFAAGMTRPTYNWDMIGYVAAAYHKDGFRGDELSSLTYGNIRKEVDKDAYKSLAEGTFRQAVLSDSSSLEQQIPFYSIRVIYVGGMRLLSMAGINYAEATYLISAFFAALSVLVLGLIALRVRAPIILFPLVVAITGYLLVARLSTPDSMACFFSLLAIFFLMYGSKAALVISALLPVIRTDFIILSLLLTAVSMWRGGRLLPILSISAAAGLYVLINKVNHNYGWLAIFNYTFISMSPYPAEMVVSDRPIDYIRPYYGALASALHDPSFLVYFLSACMFYFKVIRMNFPQELFFIPFTFVIVHVAVFPAYVERFFVFAASLMLLGILSSSQSRWQSQGQVAQARVRDEVQ